MVYFSGSQTFFDDGTINIFFTTYESASGAQMTSGQSGLDFIKIFGAAFFGIKGVIGGSFSVFKVYACIIRSESQVVRNPAHFFWQNESTNNRPL